MTRLHGLSVAAGALAFGIVTGTAQATPLSNAAAGVKAAAEADSNIVPVHGCNRVCERGPVEERGGTVMWHRHVGKACRPVSCTPH